MNLHEIFNLAYSDLSESVKRDILKNVIEKAGIQESFINESEKISPMVDFVDTLVHSEITEEALNDILSISFESFSEEEIRTVTEEFVSLSAYRVIDTILEDISPEHRARREEQRKAAAANVMTKRAQDVLTKDVNTKRLIKGSEEAQASARAKKRFDTARGIVKPTVMDKLKGAANKVYKNVKGVVGKAFAEKPEAHDIALNMLRKRYPDPLPSTSQAPEVKPNTETEKAPKVKAKAEKAPEVKAKAEKAPEVKPSTETKKAPEVKAKAETEKAPKVKAKAEKAPKAKAKAAPKDVKIDVPDTEETSSDAHAEKKKLAKEYVRETSKRKPNENVVQEIVNKTKEAENKEGFLKQEEKKKASGKGEIIKAKAEEPKKKEEAPKPQEKAKAEEPSKEAPKPQEPAKAEEPQRKGVIKIKPKSAKAEEPKKKEEAPKPQEKAKAEEPKKKEEAPKPQEKEELSLEDKRIARELKRQSEDRANREAKEINDTKKELASLEGSTNSRDIKRRNELKEKLNSSSAKSKPKLSDKERENFTKKRDNAQAKIDALSAHDNSIAKAQVERYKEIVDMYNKKLNESLVEALSLLEANLSTESFCDVLEMLAKEPKSKVDRFKEIMAEKHII